MLVQGVFDAFELSPLDAAPAESRLTLVGVGLDATDFERRFRDCRVKIQRKYSYSTYCWSRYPILRYLYLLPSFPLVPTEV